MPCLPILFWWDTEDFINPESDDALHLLLLEHKKRGIPGVFKMVGRKTRVLLERHRHDIVELLEDDLFEIGYHTDGHSVHPTIAEYTEHCDWQTGVSEILRRESEGLDITREAFGKEVLCYGQPGASYTPFVYGAMKVWGIPAYLGNAVYLGDPCLPSQIGGLFSLAGLHSAHAGFPARLGDEGLARAKARLEKLADSLPRGSLVSHGNHPNEWSLETWWDEMNFVKGNCTPPEKYVTGPAVAKAEMHRRIGLFGEYLDWLTAKGFCPVSLRQAFSLVDCGKGRLDRDDVMAVARKWAPGDADGYYDPDRRISLSAAQCVHLLARALAHPDARPFSVLPVEAPVYLEALETGQAEALPPARIAELAAMVADRIEKTGMLPSRIQTPGLPALSPARLGVAVARQLCLPDAPATVGSLRFQPGEEVKTYGKNVGPWSIHRPDFTGENLRRYTQLLAWSFRRMFLKDA
ncbi:MAG: hypothetical protein JXR37_37720 [Kiritimatiellae bacterium]|nr:hypothetical protein [Kiritimatiellia bacterium]